MNKPDVCVKQYLDWPTLGRWLVDEKLFTNAELNSIADYWHGWGNFHNGCWVAVSEKFDEESDDPDDPFASHHPPALLRLRDLLFREYPQLVNSWGDIEIWYWW